MPDIQLLAALDQRQNAPVKAPRWNLRASPAVARSANPIRSTIASITATPPATDKEYINLGLGDPTFHALHTPPPASVSAISSLVSSGLCNGYVQGIGSAKAREAVADYHQRWDGVKYAADNITLTHGVAQALDLVFSVLLPPGPGVNVLLPKPGFGAYPALLANLNTEVRFYSCIEEKGWEMDLEELEGLIDSNTKAILMTNPSNPCGSNYSRQHLEKLLEIAERHKVPVIADEIYGHMTWNAPFVPLASLSTSVPVITLSGLSKRFLLPGWRFGWVALHDPLGVADAILDGMHVWGNRFFGPSSLSQAALPELLNTTKEWFQEVLDKVRVNGDIIYDAILKTPELSCSRPQGALYVLVKVNLDRMPSFATDVDFCTALYREEAVFCLPGICFGAPGYFRIVTGVPSELMRTVGERLASFCARHHHA